VNVGVRDLRDNLSRHLAEVREGHTITVTDHGKPVARIVPAGQPTALERLIAEGRVTPATAPRRRRLPQPIQTSGIVSDLIDDQRR
jgi:prevent-host-death family protein